MNIYPFYPCIGRLLIWVVITFKTLQYYNEHDYNDQTVKTKQKVNLLCLKDNVYKSEFLATTRKVVKMIYDLHFPFIQQLSLTN